MGALEFNLEDRGPFDQEFFISKDARLPDLEIRLLDQNSAVDLTGATVVFSMDDEAGVAKVNAAAGTLSDATDGKVKYSWAALDVDTEGTFFGQFIITLSGKDHRVPNNTSQQLRIVVGPRIN